MAVEPRGFSRVTAGFSSYDGEFSKTIAIADRDFCGLCFTNLVDFDSSYGHRNDAAGYANALSEFDARLSELMPKLRDNDVLIITADHGCDPSTPSTDHSREYVPLLIYGKNVTGGADLGTLPTFSQLGAFVYEYLK